MFRMHPSSRRFCPRTPHPAAATSITGPVEEKHVAQFFDLRETIPP